MSNTNIIADFSKREQEVVIGPDGRKWKCPASLERNTAQQIAYQEAAEAMMVLGKATTEKHPRLEKFIEHVGQAGLRLTLALLRSVDGNEPPTEKDAVELIECGFVNHLVTHDMAQRSDGSEPRQGKSAQEVLSEINLDEFLEKAARPTPPVPANT